MSDTKWTPGTWEARKGAGWFVARPFATDRREAALAVGMTPASSLINGRGSWWEEDEARANAYLMAASPDLYAALEAACEAFEDICSSWDSWCGSTTCHNCGRHARQLESFRAALRKARGE